MNNIELVKRAMDEEQSYTEMLHEATNKALLAVEPQELVDYALSLGWILLETPRKDLTRVQHPRLKNAIVFIPMNQGFVDYIPMVRNAINSLEGLKP